MAIWRMCIIRILSCASLVGGCITGIVGYVQAFMQERCDGKNEKRGPITAERMVVAWFSQGSIVHSRRISAATGKFRGSWCGVQVKGESGEAVGRSRMDISNILLKEAQAVRNGKLAVVNCAPAGMADVLSKEVMKTLMSGYAVGLLEEAFAW